MEEDMKITLRRAVESMMFKPLIKGDTWYLVDSHWFRQLTVYLDMDIWSAAAATATAAATTTTTAAAAATTTTTPGRILHERHPGPIDNSHHILMENNDLREELIDELDYHLVPVELWMLLLNTFGITQGQEGIARKVIEHGIFVKYLKIEIYYVQLQLAKYSNLENMTSAKFSKLDTLAFVITTMKRIFNIPDNEETRLWHKYAPNSYEELASLEITVQYTGLYGGQCLVIETRNADGTWPRENWRNETRNNPRNVIIPVPKEEATSDASRADRVCNNLTDDGRAGCLVCFEHPRSGVFGCQQCDHWVCGECKAKLEKCPICREDFLARPPRRNRAVERLLNV